MLRDGEKEVFLVKGSDLQSLISSWSKTSIMVIGDMIADSYLEGRIARISREAPVLVLEHAGETIVPGGAANVVNNCAALQGQAYAVGLIGDDFSGRELVRILAAKGVHTAGLIIDNNRPTITKTRVMAGGQATVRQQVVRIDRESKEPVTAAVAAQELAYVQQYLPNVQAVILSDYGSGCITSAIRDHVIQWCRQQDIPCIVDSRYDILAFQGATIIKQNEAETAAALGYEKLEQEDIEQAGFALLKRLDARALLLTRGAQGMNLFESNRVMTHIPVANVSEVYDVSGAGDTVVAVMALALSAGVSLGEAARLANIAAGVVVRKFGTATTTIYELSEALEQINDGESI